MSRLVFFFLLIALVVPITKGLNSRKLDETTENKCGGCPCNNPCNPPAEPPPTPSPPPPALPPPSPPPPKKPPSSYCPPPPSGGGGGGGYVPNPLNPQYVYTTGPPANLYPVDQYFNGAVKGLSSGLSLLAVGFLLRLIALG